MDFDRVINGIIRYFDKEIFPRMNNWQETIARLFVSRISRNANAIKTMFTTNPFLKTMSIIDGNGNVDVHGIATDLKNMIAQKGSLDIEIPLMGKYSFKPHDVNVIYQTITGEELKPIENN